MGKRIQRLIICMFLPMFFGCAYLPVGKPNVVETQSQLVSDCEHLGSIAEIADTARIFRTLEARRMQDSIRAKAFEIGATHIVWEYRTEEAAAASAYRCVD